MRYSYARNKNSKHKHIAAGVLNMMLHFEFKGTNLKSHLL